MMKKSNKSLSDKEAQEFLMFLETRFNKHVHRHKAIQWSDVLKQLSMRPDTIWSLYQMEMTGGEPDLVSLGTDSGIWYFVDCAEQSPKGRRSLCYDQEAWSARKEHKPKDSAVHMVEAMGLELLSEMEYRLLQEIGKFDTKTSSWISTPEPIRKLGGALFGDRRFDHVFIYHNGAESYYAARGFRAKLKL